MKTLLILVAALAANMALAFTANMALAGPGLTPEQKAQQVLVSDQKTLDWNGWNIDIRTLMFTSFLNLGDYNRIRSPADSIYVFLYMNVKNTSHEGKEFIPQNCLKIVIGENVFDAEDTDDGPGEDSYLKNIEPTLVRNRGCYFELPRAVIGSSFIIRLSALFGDSKDITVRLCNRSDVTELFPAGFAFPLAPKDYMRFVRR